MVLYVVPTPIGNIKDITYRAVEILKESDVILCEDTRCSLKMFNYYGIKKKLISYHKFNEYKLINEIVEDILNGVRYALISDAGMPGISDPGKILINKCIEENIKVDVLPGACALVNGFVLSGFQSDIFTFFGFLPRGGKKLKETLKLMKETYTSLIVYEAPHRLLNTLNILKSEFGGDRKIFIGRELTKLFEEHFRGTIEEAINYFEGGKIRGEFVFCIENYKEEENVLDDEFVLNEFYENKNKFCLTTKENIRKICENHNLKKNYVYDLIMSEINKI